jgi:asparagine synthase (glutamine-hydrolysing)
VAGICCVVHLDGAVTGAGELAALVAAAPWRGAATTLVAARGCAAMALQRPSEGTDPRSLREPQGFLLAADARLDNRAALSGDLWHSGHLGPGEPADADLILAAYRRWGEGCADHLCGDFAFALWDAGRQRLLCARDALGQRALCWGHHGRTLVVASEPQQVAAFPGLGGRLDEVALADHLANVSADAERTIYAGVLRLPPGHVLVADEHRVRLRAYWQPFECAGRGPTDDDECAAGFLDVLGTAVADRLPRGEQPAALLLSGGLDSSSIAALAADLRRRDAALAPLRGLTYAFERLTEADESAYVRLISQHLGLQVDPLPVEDLWLLGDHEAFSPHPGWPFMAWESVERRVLERARSWGSSVLLTGHACRYSRVPLGLQAYAARLAAGEVGVVGELVQMARRLGRPVARVLRDYLLKAFVPAGALRALRAIRRNPPGALVPPWLDAGFVRRTHLSRRVCTVYEPDRFSLPGPTGTRAPLETGAVGRAVTWRESGAARYGLEVRHPYMDRRVMEYLISLPLRQIYRGGVDRVVVRRAMDGLLPDPVRCRESKSNLGPYLRYSLCDRAAPQVEALLEDPLLARLGYVDAARLRQAWAACRERGSHAPALWMTITAEMWLRTHGTAVGLDPFP